MDSAIDRNCVLEPLRKEWIPFLTVSDALIANLHLTHNIAISAIDLFLDVLRNPSFHPSHVSFTNSSDVDAHISAHRATQIVRLAESDATSRQTAGIPHNVLDLVSEYMFSKVASPTRWVFGRAQTDGSPYPYSLRDVFCLASVHRT